MKINYIIATWNGSRVKPNVDMVYYESVLKNHIKQLGRLKNHINKITIMRPRSSVKNNYYKIDLNSNIKIVDCKNEYQSYGQWLIALEKFIDDYDYHILIEDDYVPACDNFDEKLITLYEEGTYLCSLVGEDKSANLPFHCRISNGIISSNTIRNLIKNIEYLNWFKTGDVPQIQFSKLLIDNGISLVDYSSKYIVEYYALGTITNYGLESGEKIFTPIQKQF